MQETSGLFNYKWIGFNGVWIGDSEYKKRCVCKVSARIIGKKKIVIASPIFAVSS